MDFIISVAFYAGIGWLIGYFILGPIFNWLWERRKNKGE